MAQVEANPGCRRGRAPATDCKRAPLSIVVSLGPTECGLYLAPGHAGIRVRECHFVARKRDRDLLFAQAWIDRALYLARHCIPLEGDCAELGDDAFCGSRKISIRLNGLLGRDSVRRVRLFCAFRPSGFPVLFPFSHFSAQLKLGWGEAVLFAVEVAAVLAAA